jgi:FlaA1/EpsC-like NDP-sugar epimerase
MLKERARILTAAIFSLDLSLIAAAFLTAHWLRDTALPALVPAAFGGRLYPLADYLPLLPLALLIWGALLLSSGQYRSHRTVPIVEEATELLRVCIAGAVVFTLIIFALRLDAKLLADDQISRSWIALFVVLSGVLLLVEKLAIRLTARYVRLHGLNYRTVLIVGTNSTALEIADSFFAHRFWGFKVLGFVANGGDGAEGRLVICVRITTAPRGRSTSGTWTRYTSPPTYTCCSGSMFHFAADRISAGP